VEERSGLVSAMTCFNLASNDQLLALTLGAHVLATPQLAVAVYVALWTILMRLPLISLLQRLCKSNTFFHTRFTSFISIFT
jgi:hypothetical protein